MGTGNLDRLTSLAMPAIEDRVRGHGAFGRFPSPHDMHQGLKRFLRIILSRTPQVGVRFGASARIAGLAGPPGTKPAGAVSQLATITLFLLCFHCPPLLLLVISAPIRRSGLPSPIAVSASDALLRHCSP